MLLPRCLMAVIAAARVERGFELRGNRHRSGPRRGYSLPFLPLDLGAPQLSASGSYLCASVSAQCLQELGKCPPPPCFLARSSPASFSWILACLLPQRKKKKGHVCLEKYVGQWNISCTGAKGEEGRGGGEREAEWNSECVPQAPPTSPHLPLQNKINEESN
jgi:hypothetical protein